VKDSLASLEEMWAFSAGQQLNPPPMRLRRTAFEVTPNFESLRARQIGALGLHVNSAERVHALCLPASTLPRGALTTPAMGCAQKRPGDG